MGQAEAQEGFPESKGLGDELRAWRRGCGISGDGGHIVRGLRSGLASPIRDPRITPTPTRTHPHLEAGLGMLWSQCSRLATLGPKPRAPAEASPFLVIQRTQPQARSDPGAAVPAGAAARQRQAAGGASEPSPAVIGRGAWLGAGSHAGPRLRVPSGTRERREAAFPPGAGEGESCWPR